MAKLPWMKWYPNDWLSDESLRVCSLAARGLWIDCLCLMHKGVRRGYLSQENGKPLSNEQLARLSGCSAEEVGNLTQELISSGVASVSPTGVIYCRRMIREESKRQKCSEAGLKGGGNPTFIGQTKGGPKVATKVNSKALIASGVLEENTGEEKTLVGEGGVGEGGFPHNPGYYPMLIPAAKRISAAYQSVVTPGHTRGAEAIANIVALLAAGRTEEDLVACAKRYADWCNRGLVSKRNSVASFYAPAGPWEEFSSDSTVPPIKERSVNGQDRNAAIGAERSRMRFRG